MAGGDAGSHVARKRAVEKSRGSLLEPAALSPQLAAAALRAATKPPGGELSIGSSARINSGDDTGRGEGPFGLDFALVSCADLRRARCSVVGELVGCERRAAGDVYSGMHSGVHGGGHGHGAGSPDSRGAGFSGGRVQTICGGSKPSGVGIIGSCPFNLTKVQVVGIRRGVRSIGPPGGIDLGECWPLVVCMLWLVLHKQP